MSIFLISFFISFFGIILMLARKRLLIRTLAEERLAEENEEFAIKIPNLGNIQHNVNRNLKKYIYLFLVSSIRTYIRSEKFLKKQYNKLKKNIKNRLIKNQIRKNQTIVETNKFLRKIGDYKNKIRNIKNRIKKEEEIKK